MRWTLIPANCRANSPSCCFVSTQGDNFDKNMQLVEKVKEVAAKHGCTPGQVALAWVHQQGKDVFPIPGTRRQKYLEENVAAFFVHLDKADMDALDFRGQVAGDRYDAHQMQLTHGGRVQA